MRKFCRTHFSKIRECGKMKTAVVFILARMEITAVLYFLRKGFKLHFYSLGTIFEENMREV